MPQLFKSIRSLAGKIYVTTEIAVIGNALQVTANTRLQCRLKLIFDYLFFHILLLIPKLLVALYYQNSTDLLLLSVYIIILPAAMFLLKNGTSPKMVSFMVALSTLMLPMASSFFNNQDVSPKYTMTWLLSLLFCYITINRKTTLFLGSLLCAYLGMVSWIKVHHLAFPVSEGYVPEQLSPFMALYAGMYILFLMRVFGRHYRNIFMLEHEQTIQKQKQHSSLLNQHLTKQFIILKGLSRSGKSKYLDGNKELLEACLVEIEKQCESAIDYLDNGKLPES
ncbi:hypothetical protein SIO70_27400 [Chitinophaga sancti]|uniref:hypothetical protein n=1 Tax=Chitinophaga sancti TaxID=1004 RepID=UPI002A75D4DF|nr:hypothetical protein [Chitinophaga sancti]WPQ62093.1 hypothetical protein SIO70_27400 [Chitinophaga sancti]